MEHLSRAQGLSGDGLIKIILEGILRDTLYSRGDTIC